ncbi:MAG: hypothetical protein PVH67_10275 [Desulfobacterales bacterium]|jgi:hypothetical protein
MNMPSHLILYSQEDNPAYSEDGVDLTLIRWMLSLTPTERLNVLQENLLSIARLKHAGIRATDH